VKNFLIGNGYSVINEDLEVSKDADLILYSTCGFTTAAEDLAIETLNRIQKEKKPGAKLIVCGCLPEINPHRLSQVFNGDMFGPRSYERLNDILRPEKKFQQFPRPNKFAGNIMSRLKGGGREKRFYIQIQEGCPCKCSFCATKFAIKELKSKPIDDVIDDFQKGLKQGYKEFCFIGDCSGAYGLEIGENLGNLLGRVLQTDADFSLELPDISPVHLHLSFNQLKMLCAKNKIRLLYIPIQSANPRILKLMRRNCNMDHVKDMLIELKSISPVEIGTSIIAGFPSETEEELNDTIEFCEQVDFDWIYCHDFSARPGTVAAKLPGQFSPEEILERSRLVRSRLPNKTFVDRL
jgi:threonylcarbamoyladenosine tRNA methylthiotransferase MtaB